MGAQEYAQWIVDNQDKKGTPEFETVANAYQMAKAQPEEATEVEASATDKALGHPASRVAMGAASLLGGPFQLGANIGDKILDVTEEKPFVTFSDEDKQRLADAGYPVPENEEPFRLGKKVNETFQNIHESKERGRQDRGSEGFDWWELTGMVGSPVNALRTGLGTAAKTKVADSVLRKLMSGSATGAKTGAMYGAAVPVVNGGDDFFTTKAAQGATGAVAGAVIPPLINSVKGAGYLADEVTRPMVFRNTPGNWYDKRGMVPGIYKDTQDYLREITGGTVDDVINALSRARSGQTSAQALAKASRDGDTVGAPIIRLEQEIAKRGPVADKAQTLYANQAKARADAIGGIAKTDAELAAAKAARASRTKPLYKAVEKSKQSVDVAPVLSKVDDILLKNKNETSITTPLSSIRNKMKGETSPQALYSLSKEIKAMMGKTTTSGQKEYNVKVLKEIKDALDAQIGKAERAYEVAQKAYKAKSAPINRMETGKVLQTALNKSDDAALASPVESATPFLNATRDAPRTLKRATGFPRYDKLDDVLSPNETSAVSKVADELLTNQQAARVASKTSPIYPALQEEAKLQIAPMLERNVMVANALMRRLARKATPEYEKVAWDILADPKKLQEALRLPDTSPIKQMVLNAMNKTSLMAPAQAAGMENQ